MMTLSEMAPRSHSHYNLRFYCKLVKTVQSVPSISTSIADQQKGHDKVLLLPVYCDPPFRAFAVLAVSA